MNFLSVYFPGQKNRVQRYHHGKKNYFSQVFNMSLFYPLLTIAMGSGTQFVITLDY